jgi:hypothetical protein
MSRLKVLKTLQARLAAELNRRTQYWNKTSKLLALGVLILLLGGGSVYLICKAVW